MASEKEIPDKFLGKFKLEKNEKFDEYLVSKGVSWILRKMICFTTVTKIFEKSEAEQSKYNAYNQSSKQNTNWEGWTIGETFEGIGLDGKQHKITFDLSDNGDTLTEKHLRMDNPSDAGEVYRYSVDADSGHLILTLSNESLTARRFFKRIQ
ncbi:hypothetical protein niasHS_013438 [Heterodera schachtii]|uniref:Cytosolic fatty-acid binding proteins domain-containing protein n=1 Tax=Heterodera schachtii TaxID=97005 RepID=A0ABD2IC91_HETSC